MRLRAGWVAATVVVAAALVAGTVGVVLYARSAPQASASPRPLTRAELIRLTQPVRCPLPPSTAVRARPARSFPAVAAVFCEPLLSRGSVRIVRRATGSAVPALQRTVLGAPWPGRPTAQCFVRLLPTPGLVLIDRSGRQLALAFPQDSCGEPSLLVRTALERRDWIRLRD